MLFKLTPKYAYEIMENEHRKSIQQNRLIFLQFASCEPISWLIGPMRLSNPFITLVRFLKIPPANILIFTLAIVEVYLHEPRLQGEVYIIFYSLVKHTLWVPVGVLDKMSILPARIRVAYSTMGGDWLTDIKHHLYQKRIIPGSS